MEVLNDGQDTIPEEVPVPQWTYSADLSNELDWIRFTIGDTDEVEPLMSDAEIQSLLTLKGSKEQAALSCMEHILLLFAKDGVNYRIGSTSVNTTDRYKAYKAMYDDYSDKLKAGNMLPQQEKTTGIFSVGMMDVR